MLLPVNLSPCKVAASAILRSAAGTADSAYSVFSQVQTTYAPSRRWLGKCLQVRGRILPRSKPTWATAFI